MVAKIFWIFHKPARESGIPDILERTTVVLWTAAGSSPIPRDRARPRKPLGAPPMPRTPGRLQNTVQRQAGRARPGVYPALPIGSPECRAGSAPALQHGGIRVAVPVPGA